MSSSHVISFFTIRDTILNRITMFARTVISSFPNKRSNLIFFLGDDTSSTFSYLITCKH